MSITQEDIREMLQTASLHVGVGSRYRRHDSLDVYSVTRLQFDQVRGCVLVVAVSTTSGLAIEVPVRDWTSIVESGYGNCPNYIML